ncbi:hypothetical protein GGI22_002307 [Coemansia erecta]|nr:hypothetical protein GGI22_002307 [Coemansia erecta]
MTQTYELAIKMGKGSSPTKIQAISTITVHPEYDSSTFINNLAVVQFGDQSDIGWQNYIGIDPSEWDDLYFIRRSLENVPSLTWNDVIVYSSTDTPDKCHNASAAYAANSDDFLCNYAATLSIMNQNCKVPYGTVFAAIQPSDMAIVALHSHSAVYGDSMCSQDTKLHYYTLLRNYLAWAATAINRSIGGFALDSSYSFTPDSSYAMKSASSGTAGGVDIFYGNMYAQEPVDPSLSAAIYNSQAAQPSPTSNGGNTPTPTNSASRSGSSTGSHSASDNSGSIESGSHSTSSKHSATSSDTATKSNTEIGDLSDDSEHSDHGSDSLSESSSSGSSSGKSGSVSPIAIVIPVIIVILIIVGAGVVWYLRRRRRKMQERTNDFNNANIDDDDDVTPMHHPNESATSIMNYYNGQDAYNQQHQPQYPPPVPPIPQHHQQNTMSQYTTNSHMFTMPHTARTTRYDGNL